jgi:hypothetical protein
LGSEGTGFNGSAEKLDPWYKENELKQIRVLGKTGESDTKLSSFFIFFLRERRYER